MRWIVKRTDIRPILCGLLTLAVFCALARADNGARAPRFTAQTLDGETVTDTSLGGRTLLLQFWATWCPHCRSDEAAVDNIGRRFAGQGLVVLAVDEGESESKVRSYLEGHPRSCRIALDEEKALSKQFGKHGIPYYVVIDREGRIAGTQNGAGGEASLLQLLSRAGLSSHSDPSHGAAQTQASSEGSGGAKVIELSRAENTVPTKPGLKTIFVLTNGERLETDQYTVVSGFVHLAMGGQQRTIALNELDMKATTTANRERGVELKIPQNRSEVLLSF
jgi:thiol-disulfide isomerase/thioredoxin